MEGQSSLAKNRGRARLAEDEGGYPAQARDEVNDFVGAVPRPSRERVKFPKYSLSDGVL
jgi:hypothetical protein